MKGKMKIRFPLSIAHLAVIFALLAGVALAQAPKPFQGTVTAINGSTLTVKTDADGVYQVEVPADAAILRIAPGAKDLSSAEKISFSDLAVGDRALVKPDPNATGTTIQALRIIAIKQTDLALKQQKDREDWQRRGVGGLVKSVDPASGVILLTSGAGVLTKTITVHTSKATILKRYAPASVRYDDALPAPIDAIHAGDQLRARGAEECGRLGDCRRRGGFRQLPQYRRNHHVARCGGSDDGGEGSGDKEAGHHPHHRGDANAALAGDDGADAGHAAERNNKRRSRRMGRECLGGEWRGWRAARRRRWTRRRRRAMERPRRTRSAADA